MQITLNVEKLNEGLNIVTRALAPRAAKPVMDGVLIDANDDGIQLTCTDGSLTIRTWVDGTVAENGRAVLPGKIFAELVRRLPGGEVSVTVGDTHAAAIRCMSYRSNLAGMNPMDYPEMAEVEDGVTFAIPQKRLREMIGSVVFAIATDESRQILTGCLLEASPVDVRLVALDGFRLAMQCEPGAYVIPDGKETFRAVIPGRVMNELSRVLPDDEGDCTLSFDKSHMTASFGRTRLSTVLLAGEYIDYRRILPPQFKTVARADRVAVQNAIDRASLMAREGKNNLIRMAFSENELVITSSAEMGDVRESVPAALQGAGLEIAFNARYLMDVIRSIGEDEMCMKFNSNVSPSVVVPVEGSSYLYLILPVRVFN